MLLWLLCRRILAWRGLDQNLQLIRQSNALKRLHVDESRIFLLNLLKLPIGRVRHSLRIRANTDQVRNDLNWMNLEKKKTRFIKSKTAIFCVI